MGSSGRRWLALVLVIVSQQAMRWAMVICPGIDATERARVLADYDAALTALREEA